MNVDWIEVAQLLASVAVLLMLNGILAACETGLLRLRYMRGNEDEQQRMRRHKPTAWLLDHADRTAVCIRFTMTLATIALGLILFPFLHRILSDIEWLASGIGRFSAITLAFVLAASAHALIGEMVPRALANRSPQRVVRRTAGLVRITCWVTWPILRILQRMAGRIVREEPATEQVNLMDAEVQIRALGEEDTSLSPEMRRIITNTLRLRDLEVSDVNLPRDHVQYFDLNDGVAENLRIARQTGHTRFPVCDGDLDHCIGLVHVKDIFRAGGEDRKVDLRAIKREITHIPQNEPLEEALKRLLRQKMHMALVVDEFGGTAGVITLERILEELVGEIQDEFDTAEEEYHVRELPDGSYTIPGLTPIHEIEEVLGVEVKNEEVSTFGGLITSELGVIPDLGQEILLADPGLSVRIDEVSERRIISTTARLVEEEKTPETEKA